MKKLFFTALCLVLALAPCKSASAYDAPDTLRVGLTSGGSENRRYRGTIEYNGNTPVNIISLEEYLYSVVPSEMPKSWPLEALKAQAVAARSYTVTRLGIHSGQGFDICDGVHCQMYLGAGNEAEPTTQAVDETRGVFALYNGQPINATFFSSSGGVTEDGDKVWTYSQPYLKSVPELAEKEYKEWTRSFTLGEITELLATDNAGIGSAVRVSVGSGSISGRITEMTVTGTSGDKTYYKDSVRTFFSRSDGGSLDSLNFTLASGHITESDNTVSVFNGYETGEYTLRGLFVASANGVYPAGDSAAASADAAASYPLTLKTVISGDGDDLLLVGKGWGHGVGMSQFGARGMAEAGYTYREILTHYYTGIEVR